ncbi:uncharacterized protein A4U43_C07F17030 [Asparagus officinalis]|uniref:magnesium-protoporphyrin IX monomethyl ester (oxidative) cyclase n=49 Tax=Asparagales TaxID=73496 RepID=A0A5P1EHS2_ASPOF|nr:uncharacterized protein A4U43_C07F17030 [Asparagus officinalis]
MVPYVSNVAIPNRRRLYQVWPGRNKFFCGGRLIFGPDVGSLFLSMFLIAGPAITFCVQMSLKILKHAEAEVKHGTNHHILTLWVPAVLVALFLTVMDMVFLLLTSSRDPGIIPRNPQPLECDEAFDVTTPSMEWISGKGAPNLRIPRTKDVTSVTIAFRSLIITVLGLVSVLDYNNGYSSTIATAAAAAAAELSLIKPIKPIYRPTSRFSALRPNFSINASATSTRPKKSAKTEIKETLLAPRFYTTDFDEMEMLFNKEINKNLNQSEFEALLNEFKTDYNQTHFVRNQEFKEAADKMQGPLRQIFVEFLERSCTAEFSGFLLYKELGRRLKKTNPVVAEIFSLMSRDEARHAGFLNKGLSDFNLALDLGFLTKARKYTFFKPKFIFYATYLSEKIGYWRYITIYRHLKANPEFQVYPIFKYFENWCQDENRHGDFFSALLKAQPQFLNDWKAKLWSRFFCLSVYVTMYLNDCQRTAFYEGIGLDTKEFDMHVIIETNRTTARIFPAVLDVENPEFKRKLDRMVEINQKILAIGQTEDIPLVKNLKRVPLIAALVSELLAAYLMPPVESGSVDFAEFEPQIVY